MKILITGSSGFIGGALYNQLTKNPKYELTGLDNINGEGTEILLHTDKKYDLIYHFAAINGTKLFYEKPTYVLIQNTKTTLDVYEYLKKNKNTKIVFSSTCELFNGAINDGIYKVPTDEKVPVYFNDINNPRWSYSLPKALGENLFANIENKHLNIRFFNIFGPKQKDHFIPEFIYRLKKKEKAEIFGNDTRSFCFIKDAVGIIEKLLLAEVWNETINIGNDEEFSIEEIAKKIMAILKIKEELIINPSPVGSATRRVPNLNKLEKLIGNFHYTNIDLALEETINSYDN